jgi:antitoxin (DNA-binding transcriptional repressor) of toxin-antitoxin stability system
MFHNVSDKNVASIRELRTNFRRIKKKIEDYGEVVITDRGEPAYVLKLLPRKKKKRTPLPDYYAILLKHQPKPLSAEETRRFWEEERGDH